MIAGCPAGPAAADPYILADESAKLILRSRGQINVSVPSSVHVRAYADAPAPWREEALEVISTLAGLGIRIHIISNTSSKSIRGRSVQLLGYQSSVLSQVSVQSGGAKFRICELSWDRPEPLEMKTQRQFVALPASSWHALEKRLGRPIYLRRGAYFEALYAAWVGSVELVSSTVFCGDIWELDLAMPAALGANLHHLDRASPFGTYEYEIEATAKCGSRGKRSDTLMGLLEWLPKSKSQIDNKRRQSK